MALDPVAGHGIARCEVKRELVVCTHPLRRGVGAAAVTGPGSLFDHWCGALSLQLGFQLGKLLSRLGEVVCARLVKMPAVLATLTGIVVTRPLLLQNLYLHPRLSNLLHRAVVEILHATFIAFLFVTIVIRLVV